MAGLMRQRILWWGTALVLVGAVLSGCTLATVRTLSEDQDAKVSFSGDQYVSEIWDSQVLPTYHDQAQDITTLLDLIAEDEQSAIEQFGRRSGTGQYSFMVRGQGQIVDFDTSSRTGLLTVDLTPPDGSADVSVVIGPLIKISQQASVRDALGSIQYGNFVNQQEFADVAKGMGNRIIAMIVEQLGAADVDAIRDIDPETLKGKSITFVGAFSLDSLAAPEIVPVALEVVD